MEGIVKNYRRGRKHVNERQLVIEPNGITDKYKAASLVGCKVKWKNSAGKIFIGKITAAHGSNGAVRAMFSKGMPGQCIGEKVEIIRPQKGKVQPELKPVAKKAGKEKPESKK
ncbi:MAG: 50S ribosomal protein L35ae [Candidatus Diapherotrites archaeon]